MASKIVHGRQMATFCELSTPHQGCVLLLASEAKSRTAPEAVAYVTQVRCMRAWLFRPDSEHYLTRHGLLVERGKGIASRPKAAPGNPRFALRSHELVAVADVGGDGEGLGPSRTIARLTGKPSPVRHR